MLPSFTHHYVGRAPCGCVYASCYDLGDKDTARTVAEWIKDGLTVERLPRKEAGEALMAGLNCQHEPQGQLALPGLLSR